MSQDTPQDSLFSGRVSDSSLHLTVGAPGHSLLTQLQPHLRAGTDHMLTQTSLLQYGPELGSCQYRAELARFLTRHYGDTVDPDQLVLTTGATNGLHLVTSVLLQRSAVVFLENPTYFIAQSIIADDMGHKIVPVNINNHGIDLVDLEDNIKKNMKHVTAESSGRYWGMIYTIPTFHNPTGISMQKCVGENLIKLARKYNLLILCDDVYNLLNYQTRTPEFSRLKVLNHDQDCVISNGTFSKILAPGVRLGWIEAPDNVVKQLKQSGVLLSGGSQNNLMSGTVSGMMKSGLMDQSLQNSIKIYADRMRAVVDVLQSNLPSSWSVEHPGGGYFLWINTDVPDLTRFIKWLESEKKIVVMGGHLAASKENCFKNCFRISIAYYDQPILVETCLNLCDATKEYFNMTS